MVSERHIHKTWFVIAVIPWLLCFAAQFYLFAAFIRHDLINYEWSLGQIIAVTVWIPCVVEYLYIEFSELNTVLTYVVGVG